ncbi:MAG: DNA-3-methyladenine glycosylase [Thermomicrobiales bacterium]
MASDGDEQTDRLEREILPAGALDFPLALAYVHGWTASTQERVDLETATWRRALTLDGRDVLVTLSPGPTPDTLALEVAGEGACTQTLDAAERVVRRVFALDADPAPFEALAAGDDILTPLVAPYPGMRPVVIPDLYETLIWAILGQQINVGFARRLKERLVETAGHSIEIDGASYPLLPRPEEVAEIDPAALLALQFSRQKAAYVIGVSQEIAAGRLDLNALASLPDDEAIAELIRLRGVGRWTAEYLLMRGLGRTDVIPAGDVSLQLLIGTAALGRRANEAELREIADRWRPWRAWATFFVWMSRQFGG